MKTNSLNKRTITVKTDQIPPSLRIRDNQRRSRARRREYIQDLEERLHKFEALGVQATREVQAAGRKVAVENTLLRSLLKLRGVSDRDVQEYLTAHTANIFLPKLHSDAVLEARLPPWKPSSLNTVREGSSQFSSLNPECNDPLHEMNDTESTPSLLSRAINQQVIISENQISDREQRVPVDSPTHGTSRLQSPSRNQGSGQATPCETAAEIIMSIRDYSDARDVRSELGCQSTSNCMVRNMDIFHLLDKR
ncbi:hypothetical protein ANOM_000563 [Aspergillus nomiae NRRL 13137]|uniref:BZIP domain-containing protein n=1 Tax=Aspergillus nomiae NRRL (strain ATCC 15546 / NRRL 13137 / CBS 260.88 / M93) TaxID=1509407 RepID=A0A0L1JH87_ASPN3|nr:uncharacterized protein ANOM_000563 [Aspergillus nomiae NRRL 13137]KNG91135.1 hypothetical protein ANOM_000563 [Aspergillus nomiae NRRL 13137]